MQNGCCRALDSAKTGSITGTIAERGQFQRKDGGKQTITGTIADRGQFQRKGEQADNVELRTVVYETKK